MAQPQHLKVMNEAIEKHDIAIWNRWRQENPDVRPDLSGSDFVRADLKNAALNSVILKEANLRGTDLSQADLSRSDLNGANLVRTHLTSANLTEADFNKANLCEANLSDANLCEANFSNANLLGALLHGADLNKAQLADNVRDLTLFQIKTARHWENAYFCEVILEALGLPADHNEILRNCTEQTNVVK